MPEPKRCSCCEKHTLRAQEEKKKLLNRLRRIEGQVRGLNRELLAEHLRTCVTRDLKNGHEEIVDELAATLQKLMK